MRSGSSRIPASDPAHQRLLETWLCSKAGGPKSAVLTGVEADGPPRAAPQEEPEAERPPAGALGVGMSAPSVVAPGPCAALCTFSIWLESVAKCGRGSDTASALARYAAGLEDQYDSPAQIVSVYAQLGGGLDPLFFEDACISSAGDQALFQAWFARWRDPGGAGERGMG